MKKNSFLFLITKYFNIIAAISLASYDRWWWSGKEKNAILNLKKEILLPWLFLLGSKTLSQETDNLVQFHNIG